MRYFVKSCIDYSRKESLSKFGTEAKDLREQDDGQIYHMLVCVSFLSTHNENNVESRFRHIIYILVYLFLFLLWLLLLLLFSSLRCALLLVIYCD